MQITLTTIDPKTGSVQQKPLELPEGATVAQALAAAGLSPDTPCAVFAQKAHAADRLHAGDRLDIAAPLSVDPMTARRLRAQNKTVTAVPVPRHGGRHQLIKPLDV